MMNMETPVLIWKPYIEVRNKIQMFLILFADYELKGRVSKFEMIFQKSILFPNFVSKLNYSCFQVNFH